MVSRFNLECSLLRQMEQDFFIGSDISSSVAWIVGTWLETVLRSSSFQLMHVNATVGKQTFKYNDKTVFLDTVAHSK